MCFGSCVGDSDGHRIAIAVQYIFSGQLERTTCSLNPNRLNFSHRWHVQTGQGGVGQCSDVVIRVGRIRDVQRIAGSICTNGQQRGDLINCLIVSGHIHNVCTAAGIDVGVAGDRANVEHIIAITRGDAGGSRMRRFDVNLVRAGSQLDIDGFQSGIRNAALEGFSGNDCVWPHSQAGDSAICDSHRIIHRT